ncbi:MAG: tRNA (adenosine(37)-N6)-threonylcarbamoyltransferase complex transferase subunit TsaD [Chitinivibrionales bacterium]
MITLGIESSCDETSIALLKNDRIIVNNTHSQDIHSLYGGVVPEIASRAHIQKIDRLCLDALKKSNTGFDDIDLVAVTDRPGLAGALLVGISFGLGLHTGYQIPITGVNHLEGHIASVTLQHPDIAFPFLALVVSGGHTALYRVDDFGEYTSLGQTIDDAAGEAFDKIGKMLGFAYPAGRAIEQEASLYDGKELIAFPVARISNAPLNFSFSGLKTAVKYYIAEKGEEFCALNRPFICHSFQKAIITSLIRNTGNAIKMTGINTVALVGGVACNTTLRQALKDSFGENVYFPSPKLCTDNAAMIAKAGYERYKRGIIRRPRMSPSAAL